LGAGLGSIVAWAVKAQGIARAAQAAQAVQAAAWADADIRASRVAPAQPHTDRPPGRADPMNLVVVVEAGDDQVSLVDGERFERVHRFRSRPALRGAPKFTLDGRYAYFASSEGWITKFDLWSLTVAAEVRAGIELRDFALSGDGRWLLVGNAVPRTLALFDAQLDLVRSYAVATLDGTARSRVAAVLDASARRSFVVAMQDIAELWEISVDPKAEPIFDGLVHDYRLGEGIASPGTFGVRRTPLDEPLEGVALDPQHRHALGTTRPRSDGRRVVQVVNLDIRRKRAELPIAGLPDPAGGSIFDANGTTLLAIPNRGADGGRGRVDIVDARTWKPVATVSTPGPGRFVRSHARSPHAWTDSTTGAGVADTLSIIDKRTLALVGQVSLPGKSLGSVEFTRDARHVLVALSETEGALIVHDAQTFKEVARLPMSRPMTVARVRDGISAPPGAMPSPATR